MVQIVLTGAIILAVVVVALAMLVTLVRAVYDDRQYRKRINSQQEVDELYRRRGGLFSRSCNSKDTNDPREQDDE